jgi:hypothetical protein
MGIDLGRRPVTSSAASSITPNRKIKKVVWQTPTVTVMDINVEILSRIKTVQEYAYNLMIMFALFVAIPITLCFVGPRIFAVIVFCFSMGTSSALEFPVQVGPKALYLLRRGRTRDP